MRALEIITGLIVALFALLLFKLGSLLIQLAVILGIVGLFS